MTAGRFKGKAEILDTLLEDFLREYKAILEEASDDTHQTKAEKIARSKRERYRSFMDRQEDLMESLEKLYAAGSSTYHVSHGGPFGRDRVGRILGKA